VLAGTAGWVAAGEPVVEALERERDGITGRHEKDEGSEESTHPILYTCKAHTPGVARSKQQGQ
jgi:hypothetical protein